MAATCEVRRLGPNELSLIARIDRSERVEVEFAVLDGRLVERPVSMVDVPPWDPVGDGPHSVAHMVEFAAPIVGRGAALFGAFNGERLLGLAIVEAGFEPGMAWLALLHVSREARRRGAASALWGAAMEDAASAGADALYVSATPTGSAVGFYLSRGCQLAKPVHPELFALEPDDIHLTCPVVRPVSQ